MDAVENLLKKYDLPYSILEAGTFQNADLKAAYNSLVAQGNEDLVGALTSGATIEDLDIFDLENWMDQIKNDEILNVFFKLQCGSRNHLRAFTNSLAMGRETYTHNSFLRRNMKKYNSDQEKCHSFPFAVSLRIQPFHPETGSIANSNLLSKPSHVRVFFLFIIYFFFFFMNLLLFFKVLEKMANRQIYQPYQPKNLNLQSQELLKLPERCMETKMEAVLFFKCTSEIESIANGIVTRPSPVVRFPIITTIPVRNGLEFLDPSIF